MGAIRKASPGICPSACQAFIAAAHAANAVRDLRELCGEICEAAGFDYFIYGAKFPESFVSPRTYVVSGLPPAWWERYGERGYMAIDPVVHQMTHRRTTPLVWEDIAPEHGPEPERVRPFMDEARAFGLVSGVSFPLQGPGGEGAVLSLASRDPHDRIRQRVVDALPGGHLLASYLHEAARRILGPTRGGRVELSPRERECLLWAAEGKTTLDIARILDLSPSTVVFHMRNAARKLGVRKRAQAVAQAVAQGHVTPQHRI